MEVAYQKIIHELALRCSSGKNGLIGNNHEGLHNILGIDILEFKSLLLSNASSNELDAAELFKYIKDEDVIIQSKGTNGLVVMSGSLAYL